MYVCSYVCMYVCMYDTAFCKYFIMITNINEAYKLYVTSTSPPYTWHLAVNSTVNIPDVTVQLHTVIIITAFVYNKHE